MNTHKFFLLALALLSLPCLAEALPQQVEEKVWCLITDAGESVPMSEVLCLAAADDDSTFAVVLKGGDAIAGVRRAHFDMEIPTGLTKPGIVVARDVLNLTNMPAGSIARIYTIDGKLMQQARTDEEIDNTIPGHTVDFCRITSDIDMTGYNFPGIGTNDAPFCGEIDGRKNIISGLTMKRTGETGVGLVNVGTSGLEIHDLTLDATCTFTGYRYVGGFAGKVNGEKGGHVFFTNLGFEGTVNVNDNGGGIIGCIPNNDFTVHFTNCYTVGTVNGVSDNGALSGWSSYARIRNCYALVKGKGWESGHDVCRGFTPHFTNSFACGAVQTGSGLSTFTEIEMRNGTLLDQLWPGAYHQEVGTDTHPLLSHPIPSDKVEEEQPDGIQMVNGKWSNCQMVNDLSGRKLSSFGQTIIIKDGKKILVK